MNLAKAHIHSSSQEDFTSRGDWGIFLNSLKNALVEWHLTCLHNNELLRYGGNKDPILLIAFRGIQGYCPSCVVRQFGLIQPSYDQFLGSHSKSLQQIRGWSCNPRKTQRCKRCHKEICLRRSESGNVRRFSMAKGQLRHGPQSFEVCGCFIPFVTHRDRDANGKRMVGLSHKLKYLRQEARTCNEKFGRTSRNYKSLEGHQEIIKAFVEENKKLAHERMKTR